MSDEKYKAISTKNMVKDTECIKISKLTEIYVLKRICNSLFRSNAWVDHLVRKVFAALMIDLVRAKKVTSATEALTITVETDARREKIFTSLISAYHSSLRV